MEITRILPAMIATAKMLKETRSEVFRFRVSCTEYLPETIYAPAVEAGFELFKGSLTELFQTSDVALVTSGTSTLHAALTGIPQLILYKSGMILWLLVKILTRNSEFSHIGLPNIMSSREVAKEFIQFDMTPTKICAEINRLIDDEEYFNDRTSRSADLQNSFGGKAPSQELLPIIARFLEGSR